MGRSAMNFRSSITWPLTCDTLDMLGLLYQLEQIRLYVNRDDGNWPLYSRIGMMELWSLLGFQIPLFQKRASDNLRSTESNLSTHQIAYPPTLNPSTPLNPSVALTFSSALPSTWKKHPKGFPAEDRLPTKPWVGWRDGDGFSTKTHRPLRWRLEDPRDDNCLKWKERQ